MLVDRMETVARRVVLAAGELIAGTIGQVTANEVHSKGLSDFVTDVDRRCEDLIIGAIRGEYPEHDVVSEETAAGRIGDGLTWVIDPLDGTTNFIHGFPFVAVSVAVCLERNPILGFVLDPIRGELFSARKGRGAFLNGAPIGIRSGGPLADALVATGFPFRSRGVLDAYLEVFRGVFEKVSGIRRAGAAALDLAYLAAGRVDGFWEVGLKSWDIAAGSLLVMEAGGLVSDFWGENNYLANGHIVGGTPCVYPFLLDLARRHLAPLLGGSRQERKG